VQGISEEEKTEAKNLVKKRNKASGGQKVGLEIPKHQNIQHIIPRTKDKLLQKHFHVFSEIPLSFSA